MAIVGPILFLLVAALVIGLGAAAILALGSLLSHIFAVRPFEAAIVVLAVAATALFWIIPRLPYADDAEMGSLEDEPPIIFTMPPLPPRRSTRRRKR